MIFLFLRPLTRRPNTPGCSRTMPVRTCLPSSGVRRTRWRALLRRCSRRASSSGDMKRSVRHGRSGARSSGLRVVPGQRQRVRGPLRDLTLLLPSDFPIFAAADSTRRPWRRHFLITLFVGRVAVWRQSAHFFIFISVFLCFFVLILSISPFVSLCSFYFTGGVSCCFPGQPYCVYSFWWAF